MSTVEQLNQTMGKLPTPQQLKVLHFAESLVTPQEPTEAKPVEEAKASPSIPRMIISPFTGMPAFETSGPVITSEMVREALADFP